jgi:hypothetical protein
MVLSKSELIASLQNEVRILLHLISKLDESTLDFRPTPGQRSARELVRYLGMMGPTIIRYALAEPPDIEIWMSADRAAQEWDFDASVAQIAGQRELYASLLEPVSEETLRSPMVDFDGKPTTRGAFIVNLVLCGYAAYRTQLFLYLKASGQHHLTSANLWSGADAAIA